MRKINDLYYTEPTHATYMMFHVKFLLFCELRRMSDLTWMVVWLYFPFWRVNTFSSFQGDVRHCDRDTNIMNH